MSDKDLARAKINPISGLATDYLNVFNEYLMLAEMVQEGLEPRDSLNEWAPKSYQEHFSECAFADKDLILSVYEQLPDEWRRSLHTSSVFLIGLITQHRNFGDVPLSELRRARDTIASIITPSVPARTKVDEDKGRATQDEIDALFD